MSAGAHNQRSCARGRGDLSTGATMVALGGLFAVYLARRHRLSYHGMITATILAASSSAAKKSVEIDYTLVNICACCVAGADGSIVAHHARESRSPRVSRASGAGGDDLAGPQDRTTSRGRARSR